MEDLERMLHGIQVASVICNQWGDSGKGKFSDYLAMYWADVIARGTGGNNAGHTVVINGKKRIFHLLPAGIIYDKPNVLGNGMVIDPKVLCGELDELDAEGIQYHDNLFISEDAHVILPHQIARDQKKNQDMKKGGIGSTGRGIGPCYGDKILRWGVMIRDLYDKDELAKKLAKAKPFYPGQELNLDDMMDQLGEHAERMKPFVRDTIGMMHDFVRQGKKISLEGAQGLLLDIEFGTYPFVTSSSPSANGTASGVGLPASMVETFGIVKFPYMTRVGAGPFPTEFGGMDSERYCAAGLDHDIRYELNMYGIPSEKKEDGVRYDHKHPAINDLMNSDEPFLKGVGIRLAGEEYGATTGRPRRTGWTDLVALKYAVGINGPNIILTKPDVLEGAEEFNLCTGYEKMPGFTRDSKKLYTARPELTTFKGFSKDISGIREYGALPDGLKESIDFTEKFTGGKVKVVSVGPEQSQTIIR